MQAVNSEQKTLAEKSVAVKGKKFLVMSEFSELGDLSFRLKSEGHEVVLHILNHEDRKLMDGIIPKADSWHRYMGKGYVWVFDGCSNGDLQDWLREKGESVFGGSKAGDALENDRQLGQAWFRKIGFVQPESHNFKDIDQALEFVKVHTDKRWILKQNGSLPKSVNHMGKFEDGSDLILHLEDLKKKWNEHEFGGPFDCDLMEIVKGMEVAASAFFNGTDFLKNPDGSISGFINWEHKKEGDGDTGETTGEMGTLFYGCDKKNKLMSKIMGSPEIVRVLRKSKFRGVFDINGCLLDDGTFCGFEPTCRFGVPATAYEFIEGMRSSTGDLIESVASGKPYTPVIEAGWGLVQVIAAKPFPVELDVDDEATSVGEVIWPLKDGKPVKDWTPESRRHIHLYNAFVNKNGRYEVASKSGYILTVTGRGKSIKETRDNLLRFVKDSIYLSGMKYRTDLGKRVEDFKV